MDPLTETLLEVHRQLATHDVTHALCGGLAANLYRAVPRATSDVDFYIIVAPTQLVDLTRVFEAEGWEAHPYWRKGELLRLDHPRFGRVDCLLASTDIELAAVENAIDASIDGESVPVLRPESLIVFKLAAGRFQDYDAAVAILNTHGDALDDGYIVDTLAILGMSDRWQRVKDAAEHEAQDRG